MRYLEILGLVTLTVLLVACSSPEKKAAKAAEQSAKAQASVAEERLKLVDEYKKCVSEAGEDKQKVEACDSYLKAAEALQ